MILHIFIYIIIGIALFFVFTVIKFIWDECRIVEDVNEEPLIDEDKHLGI